MENEVWLPVKNYEGFYEVSSHGNVRRVGNSVPRKPVYANGYQRVELSKNGKRKMYLVHRLVAEAFLINSEGHSYVNHIDEDKTNNHVSNLEWCTRKQNNNHGTRNQRIAETLSIPVIGTDAFGDQWYYESAKEAERRGFNSAHIAACCKGKRNTHKGYTWRYADGR